MDAYLKEIKKFPPFTKEEERIILEKAKAGDKKAYNELINRNLRFVVSVAKQYQHQGLSLEDLIQEGNIGLLTAFEKFNLDHDVKFITYAVWWIKQSILKAIHDNSKVIKLPLNVIIEISKIQKLKNELEQEYGRSLNNEELAEFAEQEEVADILKYNYSILDLDEPVTEDEKNLKNIVPDPSYVDNALLMENIKDELNYILLEFSDREREILMMYFGIDQFRPYTLKEIGVDWNLTRERVRQIKEKALEKLRKNHANQLREYL